MKRCVCLALLLCVSSAYFARAPLHADRIVVHKSKRELTLMNRGVPVKTYRIALGPAPNGAKHCEGDERTPEGVYRIDSRNANSKYHRALHVSYPNAEDVATARRMHCRPGGDIMIHGLKNGFGYLGAAHRNFDWTAGCIAVTNEEIDEIWAAVPNGAIVEIRP